MAKNTDPGTAGVSHGVGRSQNLWSTEPSFHFLHPQGLEQGDRDRKGCEGSAKGVACCNDA